MHLNASSNPRPARIITAQLTDSLFPVIGHHQFCFKGMSCSKIHRRATRGFWLYLCTVSGGLVLDFIFFFQSHGKKCVFRDGAHWYRTTCLLQMLKSKQRHWRRWSVFPSAEPIKVGWVYHTGSPTEQQSVLDDVTERWRDVQDFWRWWLKLWLGSEQKQTELFSSALVNLVQPRPQSFKIRTKSCGHVSAMTFWISSTLLC